MTPEAMITISATVVLLTQFVKWAGVPNKFGPGVCGLVAFLGLAFWAYSQPNYMTRLEFWSYFSAWVLITTSAAGIFGFVRAGNESSAVTTMKGTGSGMVALLIAVTLGASACGGSARHIAIATDNAFAQAVFAVDDAELAACQAKLISQPKCDELNPIIKRALVDVRAATAALKGSQGAKVPTTLPDVLDSLNQVQRILEPLERDAAPTSPVLKRVDEAIAQAIAVLRSIAGGQ